jgi:hypothetical protein
MIEPAPPLEFSPHQRMLAEVLTDRNQVLATIYLGGLYVLQQRENPDVSSQ